ncbi:hypothetical protein ACFQE1_11000 [Halobium palmae]|uniref:Uncharacterized protein n=1 Tax=Halobium palmae TaxID=1776492 RepID=A0ABD5S0X8_9EURY
MRSEDAVRQLEYAVASRVGDEWSHWEASVYSDVFDHVAQEGDDRHVNAVIDRICEEVQDGYRPKAPEMKDYADTLRTEGGRPLTDGGDA